MPPTFEAGLRKPNSLIRRRVCAFLTRLSSLRSVMFKSRSPRSLASVPRLASRVRDSLIVIQVETRRSNDPIWRQAHDDASKRTIARTRGCLKASIFFADGAQQRVFLQFEVVDLGSLSDAR